MLAGTPTFDRQVSSTRCPRATLAVQAQGTSLAHKKYIAVLAGTPTFDRQVSSIRCARVALAVQAQGTPLAHKKYTAVLAGTPTFDRQASSIRCAPEQQAPLARNELQTLVGQNVPNIYQLKMMHSGQKEMHLIKKLIFTLTVVLLQDRLNWPNSSEIVSSINRIRDLKTFILVASTG